MPGNSKLIHSGVFSLFVVLIVINEVFPVSNHDLYRFFPLILNTEYLMTLTCSLFGNVKKAVFWLSLCTVIANKISSMLNVTVKLTEKFALDNS